MKSIDHKILWKAANQKKYVFDCWENNEIKKKLVYDGFKQGIIPLAKHLKVGYPLNNCDCLDCKTKTINNIISALNESKLIFNF